MIKIKTVYIYGYGKLESYSNGQQTIYYNNGRQSTREDLNNTYRQYRNDAKITTREIEKETLIENLYRSIDQYTDYIEDYKQQKQAEKHNRMIENIIDKVQNM